MTTTVQDSPLEAVLREHGARIVLRHGTRVAADFGSVATETAVCQRAVGLADRFGRCTFEVRGARRQVAAALLAVKGLGERAWAVRTGTNDAVSRCEPAARDACAHALEHLDAVVLDTSGTHAALGLIGPRAPDVLRLARLQPATVLVDPDGYEVLVPRHRAAAAWAECLRAGAALDIACVGFDALEHLALTRQLAER